MVPSVLERLLSKWNSTTITFMNTLVLIVLMYSRAGEAPAGFGLNVTGVYAFALRRLLMKASL